MEPKPFSIKSPEEVASAYGGNKQKIAQAIQMGALDPTSGLLAGMFIDRMRSAQAMEQAPQQSVAQQVFAPPAPPAPPAGLGAIAPQGGGMPAPPPSAPPAGLGAMPPVGMAAGGMTELPDSYGLESLPIPDNMYNEESFAGGGIVAFSGGGDSKTERRKQLMRIVNMPEATSGQREAARLELNAMDGMKGGLKDQQYDPYLARASIDILPEADELGGYGGRDTLSRGAGRIPTRGALPGFISPGAPEARMPEFKVSRDELGGYGGRDRLPKATEFDPSNPPLPGFITPKAPEARMPEFKVGEGRAAPFSLDSFQPKKWEYEDALSQRVPARKEPPLKPHSGPYTLPLKPYSGPYNLKDLDAIAPAPARTPAPRGERGVAGGATRTPAGATAPAAGTTPEMSDEAIAEKRMQDFLAAAKLPAPKGTTAEEKAARKNEDLWSALAQIGFGMAAGESPNFLTNVGKATAAAVPGMQESLKERRADTKEELKQQYAYELAQAGVTGDAYKLKLSQFDRLEDNRYRKETLAETIRGNRRREELQEQQIAATSAAADKDTGGERIIKMMAAGMPGGATPQNIAKAAEVYVKGYTGVIGGSEIGNKATDNIKDRLKTDVALASRLRALAAQDKKNAKAGEPTTLYDTEYNRLVQDETNRLQNMSLSTIGGGKTRQIGRFAVSEG